MKEIIVKSLMTASISSLPPTASLQQAIKQMAEQQHSCIIILQALTPVGIVTERDLVKILNQDLSSLDITLPVSNFMTSPVFTLNENESLFDAMVVSRAERIRHFPVVNDDEELVGLVTHTDLANAHFKVVELQSELIENAVLAKTGKLQHLNEELQKLSMEDHLMMIGNRRSMEVDLGHTHTASQRYGHLYSVILMDIDFFKRYNDHYGHQQGDNALQEVAKVLKANIRGSDRLYRYGGEELLLILPYTDARQSENVATKLVSAIKDSAIPHVKSNYKVLTISCGGACAMLDDEMLDSWQDVVKLADKNLYRAKSNGRNCAVINSEGTHRADISGVV